MGLVHISSELGADPTGLIPMRFLVDTGALYSFVTPELAEQLGVNFTASTTIVTANNVRMPVPLAFAYMRVMERGGIIVLGAMDVPEPLLGAFSLQVLGLKVDPVNERLEHSRPYGDIPVLTAAAPARRHRITPPDSLQVSDKAGFISRRSYRL